MNKINRFNISTIQGKITFTLLFLVMNFVIFSAYVFVKNKNIDKIFKELSLHNEPTITLTFVVVSELNTSKWKFTDAFLYKSATNKADYMGSMNNALGSLNTIRLHCDTLGLIEYEAGYQKILMKFNALKTTALAGYDLIELSKNQTKFQEKYSATPDTVFKKFIEQEYNKKYWDLYSEIFNNFGLLASQKEVKAALLLGRTADIVNVIMFTMPISLALSIFFWISISGYLSKSIHKIINHIKIISTGELIHEEVKTKDEVAEIISATNQLTQNLKKAQNFATHIGKGNFDFEFIPASANDTLGTSLISMRDELNKFKSEDEKRLWVNQGFAKFADIMRGNNDLTQLCDVFLSALVKYINANQGSLFVLSEHENGNEVLQLRACYAYDRKKHDKKTIEIGEGLIGQVFIEKDTVYMTDVPENYVSITSGLGEALPTSILIVPLKVDDRVLGVVEIASFNTFEQHEIDFVNKVGGDLASILISVKNNEKNKVLLEELQEKTEMMRSQEEEMRQNMEELQATQEEMVNKNRDFKEFTDAVNSFTIIIDLTPQGIILDINDKFSEVFGYSKQEIIGQKHTYYVPQEAIVSGAFEKLWEELNKGKNIVRDVLRKTKDDRRVWLRASYMPIVNSKGERYKIRCLCFDITEQKKEELAMKNELVEYKNALQLN